jgi:1,4-alpha-glucan branching enzyme
MYKYYFNPGITWKPDARARSLNPGDNYNSHVEDPFNYAWGDDAFETPDFNDMIIYELHVGTFSGRNDPVASGSIPGTYADVAAHVDHLVELGINVVELMPINEYPWHFSAGYNPVSNWAPEWKHGDPDDLKAMIDVLHQNGIAVLQDIVWNHFSSSDNYLWNYTRDAGGALHQIYFDGDGSICVEDTPWGCQADFDEPQVQDYYANSAMHWLE